MVEGEKEVGVGEGEGTDRRTGALGSGFMTGVCCDSYFQTAKRLWTLRTFILIGEFFVCSYRPGIIIHLYPTQTQFRLSAPT